ncbi:MAG: glycosyltransferase family 2 protein [Gemmatimonadales bacterium]|nr:MAG: glycosyltransferase family 2 protein [Gemmatimonadales bacterium]
MIHVCIPARNEGATLGPLLWKLRTVLLESGRDFRILVLDDASTDRTPEVLESYADLLPLHVVRTEEPLGHGAATERILREADRLTDYPKRDIAVVLRADFTESPEDLVDMVKAIEGGADVVGGTLDTSGGPPLPRRERFGRWAAPLLLGAGWRGAPVSDPLSSYRAYRIVVLRKAFRASEDALLPPGRNGWAANLELLSRTVGHARRVEESPYRTRRAHLEDPAPFPALGTLRALVPLRRVQWPAGQEAS